MLSKKESFLQEKHTIIEIVDVPTISNISIADGKNLPILVLNTSEREDIKQAIVNHSIDNTGNVETRWGSPKKNRSRYIYLIIDLLSPTKCSFIISFDIWKRGPVVDIIMKNGGCYIQSSDDGVKFSDNPNAPRILMEVITEDELKENWKDMYFKGITNMFKKKHSLKLKEAKKIAKSFINEMKIMNFSLNEKVDK